MNKFVVCEICKKKLKRITNTHLKQHNMRIREYKIEFPNSNTTSEFTRNKMSKSGKGVTGRKPGFNHTQEHKNLISKLMTGREILWKDKIRKTIKNQYDNNLAMGWQHKYDEKPNWFKNHNYGEEWFNVRLEILKRDNNQCVDCDENKKKLFIHHKIPFKHFLVKFDGDLEKTRNAAHTKCNLVTVCYGCHMKRERQIQKSIK